MGSYADVLRTTIENVRRDRLRTPVKVLIENLSNLRKVFLQIPENFRFFKEFIQNADDKESRRIVFKIFKDKIIVLNDGEPFSKEDTESICFHGISFKSPETSIGFLGLGFKTVFYISDRVQIITRKGEEHFSFAFDKKRSLKEFMEFKNKEYEELSPNFKEKFERYKGEIYKIFPIVEDGTKYVRELGDFNVMFIITLRNGQVYEKILSWVKERENLNPRILLFLNNLEEIVIEAYDEKGKLILKRRIKKEVNTVNTFQNTFICRLLDERNGEVEKAKYLLFKEQYEIPSDIIEKERELLEIYRREKIKRREIYLVFRINTESEKWLMKEDKATLHILPYSLVPLKELSIGGLHFIPGGDFLPDTSRTRVIIECEWNKLILEKLQEKIVDVIENVFKKDNRFKLNFIPILWHNVYWYEGFGKLLREYLLDEIKKYIENKNVFLTIDEEWVSKDKVVKVPQELINILGDRIKTVIEDKKILHPNFELPKELEKEIILEPISIFSYLKDYFEKLVKEFENLSPKEKVNVILWLSNLYSKYLRKYSDKKEVKELLRILEGLKFESKDGLIMPIGDLFLPSEISRYPHLEKIVRYLKEKLGSSFTYFAETSEDKKVTYNFLNIEFLKHIINETEEIKEFLWIISKDSDVEKLLRAIKENLSYNITMLYLKKEFVGKNIRFVCPSFPIDIKMIINGDEYYIEVKATKEDKFIITMNELSFLEEKAPLSRLFLIKYQYDDWFIKYGPEYAKIYEIDIEKLRETIHKLEVKYTSELGRKECTLEEIMK